MADDKLFRKDSPQNPFQTYDRNFKTEQQSAYDVFSASPIASKEDLERRKEASNMDPTAVSLPPHLFIPADAQSIDIRNLINVPPATTTEVLRFRGLKGGLCKFISYGVYFDALLFDLINLVPTVDGARVFPLHGNPNAKYKIGLGTGADLSNSNLINCQLDLQPNQELVWTFTNNDVVDVAVGVRMSGYFSQGIVRQTGRFGG